MKTRIIIEHNGRRYRVGNRTGCACKRDCDLFVGGVCDSDMIVMHLPCEEICDAFIAINGRCPMCGFKEVKVMNAERIKELDRAWSVYKEWLASGCHIKVTFAEWLHLEYQKARKEDEQ